MKNALLMWFVLIILLVILIPFGISSCSEAKSRLVVSQAQADAIRWEAQARATATTIAATTPVIVYGGVFIVSLAVVALGIVAVVKHKATAPPPQIIERQIVYLPPPNQPRRDTWRVLTSAAALPKSNTLLIEATAQQESEVIEK